MVAGGGPRPGAAGRHGHPPGLSRRPEPCDGGAGRQPVDAVLGPATDGGWWALGMRRPRPEAVLGVPTSLPDTGARQAVRLAALGMRTRLLEVKTDIDTWPDAVAVAPRHRKRGPPPLSDRWQARLNAVASGSGHDVARRVRRRGDRAARGALARSAGRGRARPPRHPGGSRARRRLRAGTHRRRARCRRAPGARRRSQPGGRRRGGAATRTGPGPLGVRPAAGRRALGHRAAARRQHRHRRRSRGAAERARRLVRPGGEVVAEVEPPGVSTGPTTARLASARGQSAWFAWARVGADGFEALAVAAGLRRRRSRRRRGTLVRPGGAPVRLRRLRAPATGASCTRCAARHGWDSGSGSHSARAF